MYFLLQQSFVSRNKTRKLSCKNFVCVSSPKYKGKFRVLLSTSIKISVICTTHKTRRFTLILSWKKTKLKLVGFKKIYFLSLHCRSVIFNIKNSITDLFIQDAFLFKRKTRKYFQGSFVSLCSVHKTQKRNIFMIRKCLQMSLSGDVFNFFTVRVHHIKTVSRFVSNSSRYSITQFENSACLKTDK